MVVKHLRLGVGLEVRREVFPLLHIRLEDLVTVAEGFNRRDPIVAYERISKRKEQLIKISLSTKYTGCRLSNNCEVIVL